jgi:hypothetical protein
MRSPPYCDGENVSSLANYVPRFKMPALVETSSFMFMKLCSFFGCKAHGIVGQFLMLAGFNARSNLFSGSAADPSTSKLWATWIVSLKRNFKRFCLVLTALLICISILGHRWQCRKRTLQSVTIFQGAYTQARVRFVNYLFSPS